VLSYDPQEYNIALADALKNLDEFEVPEWLAYVKSGANRKRPIEDPEDFYFKRAAAILRQIYKNGTVGVNRFRNRFGGKKDRGFKPEEFRKSGGKVIRVILQQADKAGLTEIKKGKKERSGRRLTSKGKEFLEKIKILNEKVEEVRPKPVEEELEKKEMKEKINQKNNEIKEAP